MMAYIYVQYILDCLPVSVSTEPDYSDDQFTNSYSNPYKLFISACRLLVVNHSQITSRLLFMLWAINTILVISCISFTVTASV